MGAASSLLDQGSELGNIVVMQDWREQGVVAGRPRNSAPRPISSRPAVAGGERRSWRLS
jgi:hypothetical protein